MAIFGPMSLAFSPAYGGQHGVYVRLSEPLHALTTGEASVQFIVVNIVHFVQGGVVRTFRCTTTVSRNMALADDPSGWILLMFRKEEREGRGQFCQTFADGVTPSQLQLADGERVYGIYRDTYYFSPLALHVAGDNVTSRIAWADVASCTSQHGEGDRTSTLTLTDGSTVVIRTADLATGSSGRISQLYHQLIEAFGHRASLGSTLKPLDAFLASANDPYCLFPNLEPHPDMQSLRESFFQLVDMGGVNEIRVIVPDDDPDTGVGLAIQTVLSADDLSNWATSLGADGVLPASDNIARQFGTIPAGQHILHAVWD